MDYNFQHRKNKSYTSEMGQQNQLNNYDLGFHNLDNTGFVHNAILAECLRSFPTPLNEENYTVQAKVIIKQIGSALSRLYKKNEYNILAELQTDQLLRFLGTYFFSPNSNVISFFNAESNTLVEKGAINKSVQSLVCNFAGAILNGNIQQNMVSYRNYIQDARYSSSERELLLGLVSVASYSSEFWAKYKVDNRKPNPDQNGYVQADAAGFLAGWAWAVYDEIRVNGSLSEANSLHRINAGVFGAITGSGFGAIRTNPLGPKDTLTTSYRKKISYF